MAASPSKATHSRLSGCGATISKRSSRADHGGQLLGDLDVATDHRLERLDAVTPDREPQLERPEAAPERDLPVAVVDDGARLGGLGPQVLRQDAEGAEQRGTVGGPEQVAVEVDAHPLVRVRAVAVGEFHAVVDPPELGRQRGDPAIAASTCSHTPFPATDLADRGCRVERHRARRARAWRRRRTGRSPAARSAAIISASASGRIANAWSCGDDADPLGPDPGDAQALLDAGVGLRGAVGDEPAGVAVGVDAAAGRPPSCRQDGDEGGLARRALDDAAAGRRSSIRIAQGGRAARASSRASASRPPCTPG